MESNYYYDDDELKNLHSVNKSLKVKREIIIAALKTYLASVNNSDQIITDQRGNPIEQAISEYFQKYHFHAFLIFYAGWVQKVRIALAQTTMDDQTFLALMNFKGQKELDINFPQELTELEPKILIENLRNNYMLPWNENDKRHFNIEKYNSKILYEFRRQHYEAYKKMVAYILLDYRACFKSSITDNKLISSYFNIRLSLLLYPFASENIEKVLDYEETYGEDLNRKLAQFKTMNDSETTLVLWEKKLTQELATCSSPLEKSCLFKMFSEQYLHVIYASYKSWEDSCKNQEDPCLITLNSYLDFAQKIGFAPEYFCLNDLRQLFESMDDKQREQSENLRKCKPEERPLLTQGMFKQSSSSQLLRNDDKEDDKKVIGSKGGNFFN